LAAVAVLFAQFFGGAAGKFGDGFLQFVQFGDGLAKASAAGNLMFGRRGVF
jgi:hypothetical protein